MAIDQRSKVLIVGQGIAGTALHHSLFQNGIKAEVVSLLLPGNASSAAAGIINPVTGPKYLKSWKFDELMEVFVPFYTSLEKKLGIDFFHKMKMYRFLPGLNQINKWISGSDDVNTATYYGPFQKSLEGYRSFGEDTTWAEIYNAYRVDINILLKTYNYWLLKENLMHNEVFSFLEFIVEDHKVTWKGTRYDLVIFAEGFRLNQNPYFNYLPLIPAKGEALLINGIPAKDIMSKRNELLTQWDDNKSWYGATLQNTFETIDPTPEALETLSNKYEDDFGSKPDVIQQLSGIRPTVSDRRPLIGQHPEFKKLYVFNGLGTKGTSLAPLMADHLVRHLLNGEDIPDEVDIARFKMGNR